MGAVVFGGAVGDVCAGEGGGGVLGMLGVLDRGRLLSLLRLQRGFISISLRSHEEGMSGGKTSHGRSTNVNAGTATCSGIRHDESGAESLCAKQCENAKRIGSAVDDIS